MEYGGTSPKILICVSRPRGKSKRMLVHRTYTCRVLLIHFVSRIFCVIENHYVHTARNFSLSGLKFTNLGEFLFFIQEGIWNLDHLLTCGIPYENTDGIPGNSAEFRAFLLQKIPRNFAEFRMFFKKFRIPSEVKNALPWTP